MKSKKSKHQLLETRGLAPCKNYSYSLFCVQLMLSQKMAFHLSDTVLDRFIVNLYSTVLIL